MNKAGIIKFLETLTVVGFAIAYWRYDLNTATAVLMVLMTLFVVAVKILGEKLNKLQFFTWLVIVILGGATLFLQNEAIIKWKTTIINAVIATALLLSHAIGKDTILEKLIADKIKAPVQKLRRLNAMTGVYFLFIALLNIVVAYTFSTDVWVNFKLFGLFALNVIYATLCLYYLREHLDFKK